MPTPELTAFADFLLARGREQEHVKEAVALTGDEARADLAVRWLVADRTCYDVRVDLNRKIVEAGFSTEQRMLNETLEQAVLDSGDELEEIINDELAELDEPELPVTHFFERPAFRYTATLKLAGPEDLNDPTLRRRVLHCLQAFHAFAQEIVEAEAE